jgi:hypothetical protein
MSEMAWLRQLTIVVNAAQSRKIATLLLQLRVLHLGFLQDRDAGVGVFPEREELFVGSECPDAGGIGIRALRSPRLQGIGASHAQMRQRSGPAVRWLEYSKVYSVRCEADVVMTSVTK